MAQLDGLIGAEPVPATIDAEQLPDGVAEFVRRPLGIIPTGFVDVADRDALHIRLVQEMQHHAQTLGADADESDVDLVAGRNISHAAQHPARNDREAHRSCGGLSQELAPRNRVFCVARLKWIFHGSSRRRSYQKTRATDLQRILADRTLMLKTRGISDEAELELVGRAVGSWDRKLHGRGARGSTARRFDRLEFSRSGFIRVCPWLSGLGRCVRWRLSILRI